MSILTGIINPAWWALAGLGIVLLILLITLAIIVRLAKRLKRVQAAHLAFQAFSSGENLEDLLKEYLSKSSSFEKELKDTRLRLIEAEKKLSRGMNRAALVRFNAFAKMGSDLSFALALINDEGSGLVLSSINSREESRVYAKPLKQGESQYSLMNEEKEAIKRALEEPSTTPT